jgi:hypothetical protein
MNDISPCALALIDSCLESTVLVVKLGRENQGNVKLAVPRGQTQGVLSGIGDDVSSSLAKVRIFSSL